VGKSKYITIKAKNWLSVYHLPTNTEKCLGYFKKCYCDVTFGYPRYWYPLGKVRLNQGKVIFCLKIILKKQQGRHICLTPIRIK